MTAARGSSFLSGLADAVLADAVLADAVLATAARGEMVDVMPSGRGEDGD